MRKEKEHEIYQWFESEGTRTCIHRTVTYDFIKKHFHI